MSPEEHNCVELVIYDNDGPEGYYSRKLFSRSYEAISFIVTEFDPEEMKDFNFELTNHWTRK